MTTTISLTNLSSNQFALKLSKTQQSIIRMILRCTYDLSKINVNDINCLMEYLDENSRRLKSHLSENKNLAQKVQTHLDVFSFYGKSFSKAQIKAYTDYSEIQKTEGEAIKESLSLIYDKNSMKNLSNSIFKCNSNYNKIAKQLTEVLLEQNRAIKSLNKVNSKAKKFLKTFN